MLVKKSTYQAMAKRADDLETENRNYTDIVTQALIDASADTIADSYLSALEISAGALSRAFASSTVGGAAGASFTPWTMAQIGRELVEQGEAIWFRIGRRLIRGDNYEISPDMAEYVFNLPSGAVRMAANRVIHVRWNVNINNYRGVGALQQARNLRTMTQKLEQSLSDEMGAAVGYLLPVPADGNAASVEQLKQDLAKLKGNIALIETARAGWGQGTQAGARRDFDLARMGPDVPDSSVNLYRLSRNTILAATGYPPTLANEQADGTGQREAWRRYLHGTVAPLGALVVEAASMAGLAITIEHDKLFASDIMGRARAFQSMVGGGMDMAKAAALSGLIAMDD